MTLVEKVVCIMEYCDIYEENEQYVLDTSGMVGTIAGRTFSDNLKSGCVEQAIEYFDKEYAYEKESLVKRVLKQYPWS